MNKIILSVVFLLVLVGCKDFSSKEKTFIEDKLIEVENNVETKITEDDGFERKIIRLYKSGMDLNKIVDKTNSNEKIIVCFLTDKCDKTNSWLVEKVIEFEVNEEIEKLNVESVSNERLNDINIKVTRKIKRNIKHFSQVNLFPHLESDYLDLMKKEDFKQDVITELHKKYKIRTYLLNNMLE
ncbi:hypothetical protein [Virgibacillus sp. DJP39]|uniref:hypothetical protein n=1 Tax=Virgibacillus sp. DJP39 TaxID=3409790 RepID=UPI003BB7E25F